MKVRKLRTAIPVLILVVLGIGLALNFGTGTLSAFGWGEISLICPLGAITSMLAGKVAVPRALISLALVVIIVLLTGRSFCSWACPVPIVQKLRDAFRPRKKASAEVIQASNDDACDDVRSAQGEDGRKPAKQFGGCGTELGCAACKKRLARVDSRHFVLGGAVLSAAIFGFPVFCLICPIGLTFGTVLLVIALFGYGDVTWSAVLVPALLLVEVVFFRKWCSKICPMGAFLSLISKGNKTFRPEIDPTVCFEKTRNATCGKCTRVCDQGINLRDARLGASRSECTRCLACVEACPSGAIHLKALAGGSGKKPVKEAPRNARPSIGEGDAGKGGCL